MDRGDLGLARADLAECARRALDAGFPRLVFKAQHNLGYLEFLAGRLPLALERMEAAARSLPGPARAIALLDRARVLLEAGLVAVADSTLAEAAEIFAADRLPHDLAEVELARAECAMLRGDVEQARAFAASARRRFARRGDEAWVLRATLLGLQVETAALEARPDELPVADAAARRAWASVSSRASRLAEQCRRSGRPVWAYAASLVALEADLARGALPDPAACLAALGPVAAGDPISVRLHGRRVRALLALAAEDPARAGRHVREGQRDLGVHRARFGSLDLRTAGAVHGTQLARMDLDLALASGQPGALLDAAERTRAVVGGTQRVNPPRDPDSAALLAELRQLIDGAREVMTRPATDRERTGVRREGLRLKQAILARSWHRSGDVGEDHVGTLRQVRATLRARPGTTVLDVLEHRGRLLAVRVQDDRVELHDLGDADLAREQTRRVHADLEVVSNPLVPQELRAAAGPLARGSRAGRARSGPSTWARPSGSSSSRAAGSVSCPGRCSPHAAASRPSSRRRCTTGSRTRARRRWRRSPSVPWRAGPAALGDGGRGGRPAVVRVDRPDGGRRDVRRDDPAAREPGGRAPRGPRTPRARQPAVLLGAPRRRAAVRPRARLRRLGSPLVVLSAGRGRSVERAARR